MKHIRILLSLLLIISTTFFPENAEEDYFFERSITGATGWACCDLELRQEADPHSEPVSVIAQGESFCIIEEEQDFWKIAYDNRLYYIDHNYCLINLPDVLPSVQYNITNAYSSIFRSSYQNIPGLTGAKLYQFGRQYNYRLEREEFAAPMLYSTAKMVAKAQYLARQQGYTLKIYDTYRPHSVTAFAADRLREFYRSNSSVRHNIDYDSNGSYWGQSWYLAQGTSAHNTGSALDVTLVSLETGEEITMASPMHELSTVSLKGRGDLLNDIFTEVGMTGIASEWWHFQDNAGNHRIKARTGAMDFQIRSINSIREDQVYYYMYSGCFDR